MLFLLLMVPTVIHAVTNSSLIHCVSPMGSNETYEGKQCMQLNEYFMNTSFYFQSNSIFYIVNGTHFVTLNEPVLIQSVANISLVGVGGFRNATYSMGTYSESLSNIVFNSSGLSFVNVQDLSIINITFTMYGPPFDEVVAIIQAYTVTNFVMVQTFFINIFGTSVSFSSSIAMVTESFFLNCSTALYADFSTVSCNNCYFENSNYSIYSTDSIISATQSKFSKCTNGFFSNETSTLSLAECDFVNCTSAAILIDVEDITLAQCTFTNCISAVSIFHSTMAYLKNCNFTSTINALAVNMTEWMEIELCNFNNVMMGVNATSSTGYLAQCTFTNCTNCLIGFAKVDDIYGSSIEVWEGNFTTCFVGVNATYTFLFINSCEFSQVAYPIVIQASYAYIGQSLIANSINAGMFIYSEVYIENTLFSVSNGSALYAIECDIIFLQTVTISNSSSTGYGGALYLSGTDIYLLAPTNVSFFNNTAQLSGGAVYVENQHSQSYCFFHIIDLDGTFDDPNVHLFFEGNDARQAGNDVFASLQCIIDLSSTPNYGLENKTNEDILRAISSPLTLAADPIIVCMIRNEKSECSNNQSKPYAVELYPGQYDTISIVTLDEYSGRAPSLVFFRNISGLLFKTRWNQAAGENYTINSSFQNVTFELIPQALLTSSFFSGSSNVIQISVSVFPCPLGFTFDPSNGSCICSNFLSQWQGVWCNISNYQLNNIQIYKPPNSWIGTTDGSLAFHKQCLMDYCSGVTSVSLDRQDDQCTNNHTGIVCGGCSGNMSEVFGGSLCQECNNFYLLLLIPFAMMGLALVVALLALNLTVSNGTLNGFIFYANIVKINESILLQTNNNTFIKILSVFISWLNLDLGIVTCFYHRMSTPGKLGLQFVFPAYIFILLGLIIFAGRYSTRVSKLCRHNVVPVLATLVLLSYGKVLKTVIGIFSVDYIILAKDSNSTNNIQVFVWKYNANIMYLQSYHLPLFIIAFVVAFFFILPYTLLLLLTPCIQSKSNGIILRWVNKFKPLIDSYEGPYIGRHRFWTGLLLLIRIPIYVSSALGEIANNSVNLIVAIAFTAALVIYLARFNVYKNSKYCLLEMFLFVNLIGLCSFPLLFRSRTWTASSQSSPPLHIPYIIFVCSAFITFIIVISLQIYHRTKRAKGKSKSPHIDVARQTSVGNDSVSGTDAVEEIAQNSAHFQDETKVVLSDHERHSDLGYREELLDFM